MSVSGAALESVVVEAMIPPVAVVIDCQTDSKLRCLDHIRLCVKKCAGNVSPTEFLFQKKGRIVLRIKDGVQFDDVLESALDLGALDADEEGSGHFVILTDPVATAEVATKLSESTGLDIAATSIEWIPNEDTMAPVDDEIVKNLTDLVDRMHEEVPGFRRLYTNATRGSTSDAQWANFESKLIASASSS